MAYRAPTAGLIAAPALHAQRETRMAYYVVGYDLHNQRTYAPIWEYLKGLRAVRLLESLWLVQSSYDVAQIRDDLSALGEANDSFAVVEVKPLSHWSTRRGKTEGTNWLTHHIQSYR